MAFPETPQLDTFIRADEDPLASPWLGPLIPGIGEGQFEVTSNVCKGNTTGVYNGMYRGSYGPNCECFIFLGTLSPGNRIEVYARIVDVDAVLGTDAYCVSVAGTAWTIRKITNSSSAAIGATFTGPTLATEDGIGIKCSDDTIEAWHKPAASFWSQQFTRTDSTWTGAGAIGARWFGDVYTITGFYGGTLTAVEKQSFYMSRRRAVSR